MKLTTSSAAKLSLPEGRNDIIFWDDGLPGFGMRIRAGGAKTWIVQYRAGLKKIRRQKIGDVTRVKLERARKEAKLILAEVQLGNDPQEAKLEARREAELFERQAARYLEHLGRSRTKPRSQQERVRHIKRDWKVFDQLPIHTIERRDVATRLVELANQHGPVAANRSRSTLSAFFSWALGEGLVEQNPVIGTNKQGEEKARERVLGDAELISIWNALADDQYSRIVRLLLLTGQRRQEVAAVTWHELDLDNGIWRLSSKRTKNGGEHEVPLSKQAQEILMSEERRGSRDFVFGTGEGPFSGFSRCKARLDKKCGVSAWTLHDLRRTMVTGLNELGVAPHVVEAAVNHVSGFRSGVAGVYNRAKYTVEKRNALQLWADHLTSLVEKRHPCD